ncbi:MAG: ATP-binding cassette domain-containing protein, partial [Defluviitaleaceae bacterium]|nr:ATP-binding cassette domain-containing protein [Defluviitaleaceae bacterium]
MIELAVSGVYKTFGFTPVLKDASFEIYTGEHVGLVGRNGAGKTTLFNLILGKESPDTGTVSIRKGATLG